MLRSAHYFIYQRTFDVRRTPEYFNRILLGAVSGGAIILFVEYLSKSADDGSTAHVGSTALGFIAGYSGDFLFNTVERIVNAIFPKDAYGNYDTSKSAKGGSPGGSSNNGSATDNNGSATDNNGSATDDGSQTRPAARPRPPRRRGPE